MQKKKTKNKQTDKQTNKQTNKKENKKKVCKPELAVGTCDGRPNGFESRLASSRKSQKVVLFYAYTVDLRQACVDMSWVVKRCKTCVDLRSNLSSTKSTQVGSQVKRKSKTCDDFRVHLASGFRPKVLPFSTV